MSTKINNKCTWSFAGPWYWEFQQEDKEPSTLKGQLMFIEKYGLDAMMKYRIYSSESLREIYDSRCADADSIAEIQNVLEAAGCTFVDKLPFAYTAREIEYLNEEFRRMYPDNPS